MQAKLHQRVERHWCITEHPDPLIIPSPAIPWMDIHHDLERSIVRLMRKNSFNHFIDCRISPTQTKIRDKSELVQ